jgi:gliding motility-associated-like protein
MTRWSDFNIRKIVLILLVLFGPVISLFSQDVKEISGVVNVYRKVTAVATSPPNNVTLASVDSVAAGDTIMLIQMRGVKIATTDGSYGQLYLDKFGSPGSYEILLVDYVDVLAKKVYFTRYMQNSFDVRGNVQLIVIPYYDRAKVKGKLTSRSWDSTNGVGGVLALIVGSKLELDKLNGEIDVSGKGFRGGLDTIGVGDCINDNYMDNNHDAYPRSWQNAGYKGEGVASHDLSGALLYPIRSKGQGINYTGGGGGNGRYSGGGGGSNRGVGSDGDREKTGVGGCGFSLPGAVGGTTNKAPLFTNGIYFGGGGGASTHAQGEAVSSGGNGGGIVIIMADTISGNGKSIKANGSSAPGVTGNGGGGGGGAGGSVLLSLRSFSENATDSVKISVRGGNGGFHPNSWGSGGGGGGGLFSVSLPLLPGKIVLDTAYGTPAKTVFPQGYGDLDINIIPKLNGFLFNAIRSEVTGNQTDSICSNVTFGKLIGTMPIGGKQKYTYRWEMSVLPDSNIFMPITTDPKDSLEYSPGTLTQTTWFRRIVSDNSTPVITDISIPVKVIVHQAITGNIVGSDITICYGQNPLTLVPLNNGPSDGHYPYYNYKWLQNTSNVAVWDTTMSATGDSIRNAKYDPPALNNTTYYKRFVTSGRCINYSSVVKITVLPSIQDNIIFNKDTAVCQPYPFDNLRAKNVSGGNGSYYFTWQESLTNSYPWETKAVSTVNQQYHPVEDPNTTSVLTRYYRRMVISGPNGVCRDSTSGVKLTQYPKITNNKIITESGELFSMYHCQDGSQQLKLFGSQPQGGNGTYTYQWLAGSSYAALSSIPGKIQRHFEGDAPEDFLAYSRLVTDGSGLCINATGPLNDPPQSVFVYRKPVANAGIAADICGGTVTLHAVMDLDNSATDGTGWEFSMNKPIIKSYSDSTKAIAMVKVDTVSFDDEWGKEVTFSWKEVNGRGSEGECYDRATVKVSFFTRVKELGPNRDTSFYTFSDIIHLDADPYMSWETGLWTTITGSDNFDDHTKPDATIDDLFEGKNSYKWTVSNKNSSGTAICYDEYLYDVKDISIYIPNAFSPNGDGLYDKFIVKGLDPLNQEAELRIVNSAGTEVFYTTNRDGKEWVDWDGRNTNGNDLPEGTYYYLLRLIDNDNNTEVYKKQGFVVLKRYGQVD